MRSSVFLAATSAVLAMASPVEKREYVTTVQMHYYTVTVTDGQEQAKPTALWGGKARPQPTTEAAPEPTTQEIPVVTVTALPEPEPTTPSLAQPVVTVTSSPEPVLPDLSTLLPTSKEAAVSATSQPAAPADNDMPANAVYQHNLHRANHSAPEVTWDDKIAGYASNTAATCHFAHDMDQGDGGYGQNLAMWAVSSGASSLGDVGAIKMATTDMWYNGEFAKFLPSYYGMATPDMSDFESWGHISQLLWVASTQLGCSVKLCEKGTMYSDMDAWFMVCNYSPPGNVGGAYATNVLKPLGEPVVTA